MIVGEVYVGALLALATSEGVTRLYRRLYRPPPPVAPAITACSGYADL
jgi:hypothetical protein